MGEIEKERKGKVKEKERELLVGDFFRVRGSKEREMYYRKDSV